MKLRTVAVNYKRLRLEASPVQHRLDPITKTQLTHHLRNNELTSELIYINQRGTRPELIVYLCPMLDFNPHYLRV